MKQQDKHLGAPRKGSNVKGDMQKKMLAKSLDIEPVVSGANPIGQKKRRWRQGTVANRKIIKYQKSIKPLIPKLPFQRITQRIASTYHNSIRFNPESIKMLQCAAENYLHDTLSGSSTCAMFTNRQTLRPKHIVFYRGISNDKFAGAAEKAETLYGLPTKTKEGTTSSE